MPDASIAGHVLASWVTPLISSVNLRGEHEARNAGDGEYRHVLRVL
jgi:hypothetical protein